MPRVVLVPVGFLLPCGVYRIDDDGQGAQRLPDDPVRTLAREICFEEGIPPNEANVDFIASKIGKGIEEASELLHAANRDADIGNRATARKLQVVALPELVAKLAERICGIEQEATVAVRCAGLLKNHAGGGDDAALRAVSNGLRRSLAEIHSLSVDCASRLQEIDLVHMRATGPAGSQVAVARETKAGGSDDYATKKPEAVAAEAPRAKVLYGPGPYITARGTKALWHAGDKSYAYAGRELVELSVETGHGVQRLTYTVDDGEPCGIPNDPLRIVGDWAADLESAVALEPSLPEATSGSEPAAAEGSRPPVLTGPGEYETESGLRAVWPEGRAVGNDGIGEYVALDVYRGDGYRVWSYRLDGTPLGGRSANPGNRIKGLRTVEDPSPDHQADEAEPSAEEKAIEQAVDDIAANVATATPI